MPNPEPNPGHGYIVREPLGRGRWKEVYRAVKRGEFRDHALARFISKPSRDALLKELTPVLKISRLGHSQNVAYVYDAFEGDDHFIYFAEELLFRPLTALSPLRSGDRFFRFARDLSAGLATLHSISLVHRDLKLDNCGIDYRGTAKIFDLGSATSEGGEVRGTILTRAPELFAEGARCTKQSDVWALGALLFALRTGDYPYVNQDELRNRPALEEPKKRAIFDSLIGNRIAMPDAESSLRSKVHASFPSGPREILESMLEFAPEKRPTAEALQKEWEEKHRAWMPPQRTKGSDPNEALLKEIKGFLEAVIEKQVGMSTLQWHRMVEEIDSLTTNSSYDKNELQEIRILLDRLSGERQSVEQQPLPLSGA
jgi:serine/threonine protein kinase